MTSIRNPATRSSRRALITGLALAVSVVAACGGDTSSTVATTAEPTTPDSPTTTVPAAASADANTIVVRGVDYSYEGLPGSVPAGTTITLENGSDGEAHEFVAIRLPDDETRSVEELMQLPPDELAAFFPLVETVVIAPPGAEGVAVEGDGSLAEPGRYAVICAIPTGADPVEYLTAAAEAEGGPPDVAGGPPHFAVGMWAELTVVE